MSQDNARGLNQPVPIAGDVTGILSNATVVKLQGNSVASTAPTDGQILTWNTSNTRWEPATETLIPINVTIVASAISYTVVSTDGAIVVTSSANGAIILMPASTTTGRIIYISVVRGGAISITVTPFSGTTINGSASNLTWTHGGMLICYDGTNWTTIGNVG